MEGLKAGSFLYVANDTHHHQLAHAAAFTAIIISVKSIGPLQQLLRQSNVFYSQRLHLKVNAAGTERIMSPTNIHNVARYNSNVHLTVAPRTRPPTTGTSLRTL